MAISTLGIHAEVHRRPQVAAASLAAFFFLDFFDALAPLAPEAASAVAAGAVLVSALELAAARDPPGVRPVRCGRGVFSGPRVRAGVAVASRGARC